MIGLRASVDFRPRKHPETAPARARATAPARVFLARKRRPCSWKSLRRLCASASLGSNSGCWAEQSSRTDILDIAGFVQRRSTPRVPSMPNCEGGHSFLAGVSARHLLRNARPAASSTGFLPIPQPREDPRDIRVDHRLCRIECKRDDGRRGIITHPSASGAGPPAERGTSPPCSLRSLLWQPGGDFARGYNIQAPARARGTSSSGAPARDFNGRESCHPTLKIAESPPLTVVCCSMNSEHHDRVGIAGPPPRQVTSHAAQTNARARAGFFPLRPGVACALLRSVPCPTKPSPFTHTPLTPAQAAKLRALAARGGIQIRNAPLHALLCAEGQARRSPFTRKGQSGDPGPRHRRLRTVPPRAGHSWRSQARLRGGAQS